MRSLAVSLLAFSIAGSIWAQQSGSAQQPTSPQQPASTQLQDSSQQPADSNHVGAAPTASSDVRNLLKERLGAEDVVGITVYDAPELSHNVRIDADGNIRLPMVRQHIHAAGLTSAELENAIATALVDEHVLVDPIVTVAVVEYHSRPITVVGAVRNPMTFQAGGAITLLETLTRAGGITENAGAELTISHPSLSPDGTSVFLTERIPLRSLRDISSPASNMKLEGGETIRVPSVGQVFVAGNVKHPGPYSITNDSESSVLRALAIAGGLDSFSSHTAYIYRTDEDSGLKSQIPIPIKKIIARKSPDVPLHGDDMLYVPNVTGERVSAKAIEIAMSVGLGLAGILLYLTQ